MNFVQLLLLLQILQIALKCVTRPVTVSRGITPALSVLCPLKISHSPITQVTQNLSLCPLFYARVV